MSEGKETTKWYVALLVLIIIAIAIRMGYQQGRKLLLNLHPWDYIADAIIIIALIVVIYMLNKQFARK